MSVTRKADPLQAQAIELITRIRRKSGLAVTEIARQSGLSPSTLTRLYPHPRVHYTLSSRTIAKITAQFPDCVDVVPAASTQVQDARESLSNPVTASIPVYALENDPSIGSAKNCLSDKFTGDARPAVELWNDLPLGPITTIPFLIEPADANHLVGVYLSGYTMEPRLKAGEIAILDKKKPVPLHADVLVRLDLGDGKVGAIIAQIMKRDALSMHFEFLLYPDRRLVISRSQIIEVLPIIAIMTNSY